MGEIDLADIYNQLLKSAAKRQYVFNLMLVGERGCGKTTLANTLFRLDHRGEDDDCIESKSNLSETTMFLEENGVKLRLRIVETRKFCVHRSGCWKPLIEYIDSKYHEYVMDELRGSITDIEENRVHCCLYFISPIRGLEQPDIDCLKMLHNKVNIIPVIGRADALTPEDRHRFKQIISRQLEQNQIRIYKFPEEKEVDMDDSGQPTAIKRMKDCAPFAVIGSNIEEKRDGEYRRVLKNDWATFDVFDQRYDVLALSKLMIRFYLIDLIETTHSLHYSNYIDENLEKTPDQLLVESFV